MSRLSTRPAEYDTYKLGIYAGETTKYTLTGEDYVLKQGGSCISTISKGDMSDGKDQIILGDTFLRKFAPTFSFESGPSGGQVALAKAKTTP